MTKSEKVAVNPVPIPPSVRRARPRRARALAEVCFWILLGLSACSAPGLELGHGSGEEVVDAGAGNTKPDSGLGVGSIAPPESVPVCPIPPDVEAFVSALVEGVCRAANNCCSSLGFTSPTVEACIEDGRPWVMQQIGYSCVSLKPQQAAICLAELDKMAKVCPLGVLEERIYDAACESALTGTVPQGEPCVRSFDCVAPMGVRGRCLLSNDNGVESSQCIGERYLRQEGAPCSGWFGGDRCDPTAGLYCGISETCRRIGQLGEPCEPGWNYYMNACVAGAYCMDNVCRPVVPKGGACTTNDECGWENRCNDGICGVTFGEPCRDGVACDRGTCGPDPSAPDGPGLCLPMNSVSGFTNRICSP